MSPEAGEEGADPLSPDDAFQVLGNETRLRILQTLGEADEPYTFSALYDAVGVTDSGQFNYHLGKLTGHFVAKTADGYTLRRAGERVVEAVLSGAVSEAPVVERTRIDQTCYYCGAPVEVNFAQERVGVYCSSCAGNYGGTGTTEIADDPATQERLGYLPLPPAGVRHRGPEELLSAATSWGHLELFAAGVGICPRCSASLESAVNVCENHAADSGRCDTCGNRHAITCAFRCTNCIYSCETVLMSALLSDTTVIDFLTDHGFNPISPSRELSFWEVFADSAESIRSTDPFEARLTLRIADETLEMTVGEDLTVTSAERYDRAETGS